MILSSRRKIRLHMFCFSGSSLVRQRHVALPLRCGRSWLGRWLGRCFDRLCRVCTVQPGRLFLESVLFVDIAVARGIFGSISSTFQFVISACVAMRTFARTSNLAFSADKASGRNATSLCLRGSLVGDESQLLGLRFLGFFLRLLKSGGLRLRRCRDLLV